MQNNLTSFEETVRIEVLNFQDRYVGELSGAVVNGSFQLNGDSAVRRTLSLSVYTGDDESYNMISINRKFRVFLKHRGLDNSKEYCLGHYVATSISKPSEGMINLTAMDKMAFLNGTVAGNLEGVLYADRVYTTDSLGNETETKMKLDEILYYVVAGLGEERRENILISDVPEKIKAPMVYEGSSPIYMDSDGNIYLKPGDGLVEIDFGDYVGYTMIDFVYPQDLIKQPGNALTTVLDDIKNLLGNHEYFYDEDGRFVFQEVKNYLNKQFQNYTKLGNGDYVANLAALPITHKFTDDSGELISISSTPQWNKIKNNFIVWGTANGVGLPVCYHLVVDSKPSLPEGVTIPYQQFLINQGDANPTDPGPYYGELKSKFPQIYDAEKNEWKGDINDWNYYFDMVDSGADYSKYSVSEIGKRTMSITDPQVGRLFSPSVPDYVIVNLSDADAEEQMDYLTSINQKYIGVENDLFKLFKRSTYSKSAFEAVRELLYNSTTSTEQVNLMVKPMMELQPNTLISIDSPANRISGEYLVKSISYGFGATMNVTAVEVDRRT